MRSPTLASLALAEGQPKDVAPIGRRMDAFQPLRGCASKWTASPC